MIRADIWIADPDGLLAAGAFDEGALIRLERSDDDGETYAEITTLGVVSGVVQYQFWDTDGDETSLYRWRVSDASDTLHSPYSDPFAGTNPAAAIAPVSYASLDYTLGLYESGAPSGARLARLGTLLGVATDQLVDELRGRDYFRHPATGTATWTLDVLRDTDVLHLHDGLISLSLLEVSTDGGVTYEEVDAADYVLRGQNPRDAHRRPTGEPYFHVVLTGKGTRRWFPRGVNAVRGTGPRGYETPPTALSEATAQRARQLMSAEESYSGSEAGGLDQFGRPATTDRFWPQSLYNFLRTERARFRACVSYGSRP